jgi:hypothetical protein
LRVSVFSNPLDEGDHDDSEDTVDNHNDE